MNITWIIGNGFDLNLGLKTSYKDFLSNKYLAGDPASYPAEKKLLIDRVEKNWGADVWSDLECLKGKVTASYSFAEYDLFAEAFRELQDEMRDYLIAESKKSEDILSDPQVIDEGWQSITDFASRLTPLEARRLGFPLRNSDYHKHNFISLNYTRTLDALLKSIGNAHNPLASRHLGGNNYTDSVGTFIHLHGTLAQHGGIVFAVSDEEQIANEEFRSDRRIKQALVKENLNHMYGNEKPEKARTIIHQTDLFLIYGCSMGATDAYIWREIAKRLLSNKDTAALILKKGVPDPRDSTVTAYQSARDQAIDSLLSYGGADESAQTAMEETRLVVRGSSILFDFSEG